MDARTVRTETPFSTPTGGPQQMPLRRGLLNLAPVNRRRWESFKRNRRGFISLWIFMALFVLSLFAEFIANDKPLYLRFDGNGAGGLEMRVS